MNYLIQEQSQLREIEHLFESLSRQRGHVAVDTEFFREKTYMAKLCLVQLGIGADQYCIDVLAIEDLTPLADLFADQNVLKLFHAARQDLEVIVQTFDVLPKPIFDTQIAAAFSGLDMQIGYSAMVQEWLGIELPKSQARTDWTRRPLSEVQLQYAADDVAYLEQLYQRALENLHKEGKMQWFEEEIESCYEMDKYVIDPQQAYRRLSGGNLKLAQQYRLRALAAWREQTAQQRDIPRNWVARDDALYELAVRNPQTVQEILDLGVFGRKSSRYLAPQASRVLAEVEVAEERLWPRVEPLTKQQKKTISKMMSQLNEYAQEHHIAQALLGTRKDVESLYRNRRSGKLLEGWRSTLVGEPLLASIQETEVAC